MPRICWMKVQSSDRFHRNIANSRKQPGPSVERGFTLIEVLVVVAIIALLVAILLPSLSNARRKAQEVQCATNLRTCGQGIAFYLQANNDFYMGADWTPLIHKYIQKNSAGRQVGNAMDSSATAVAEYYLCPGDTTYHHCSPVTVRIGGVYKQVTYALSYGINDSLIFNLLADARPKVLTTDQVWGYVDVTSVKVAAPDGSEQRVYKSLNRSTTVARASEITLLFDSNDDDSTHALWGFDQTVHNNSQLQVHHKTGNNFLYADYHVGYRKHLTGAYFHGAPAWPWNWVPINGWQVTKETNKYKPTTCDCGVAFPY
jgi:prepilin-type N-terminal cleavage/methylation domain-containing protein